MKRNFTTRKLVKSKGMKVFLSCLLLLSLTSIGANAQTKPELIYYRFNGSGSTVPNEALTPVGNANATITGMTQGASGLNGTNALLGPGSSTNHVVTGWSTNLTSTSSWTIGMWVYNIQIPATFGYYFGDNSAGSFRCFAGGAAGTNGIVLRGPFNEANITGLTTGDHYLCWVYDASTNQIRGYLDGVLNVTVNQGTFTASGTGLIVGGYQGSTTGVPSGTNMDEFRLYNRALDVDEILTTMNFELPLKQGGNNAAVSNLTPLIPCAGANDIKLSVKNSGKNIIDSFLINWTINGVAQTPLNYTASSLDTVGGTGPIGVEVTLGSHIYTLLNQDTITAWIETVNGEQDTINTNDTADLKAAPALGGNFTLGGVGADYQSLQAFFDNLHDFGVCAPVVLNVDPLAGPYDEQIEVDAIPGASAVNTVIVKGNKAVLEPASTSSAQRQGIRFLAGAEWITIDSLDIDMTNGTTYSWGVHFRSNANNIVVKNCEIEVLQSSTSQSNQCGIVYSNSNTSATTDYAGSSTRIENCEIIGGDYGISFEAGNNARQPDHHFVNNIIRDFGEEGIHIEGTDVSSIVGNDIHSANRNVTVDWWGIRTESDNNNLIIDGNKIHDPSSSSTYNDDCYGIYGWSDDAFAGEIVVQNNLIYNMHSTVGIIYGVFNDNGDNFKIYNNTIVLDDKTSTSGTTAGIRENSNSSEVEIRNNIVYITRTGSGDKYGIYVGTSSEDTRTSNNLVYLNATNSFYGSFGSDAATLADWQEMQNDDNIFFGINSLDFDPQFRDPANVDYQPKDARVNAVGAAKSTVVNDVTGATRNGKLDIGAYAIDADFGITAFTLPNATECEQYAPEIKVTLKNFGTESFVNIPLGLLIDGSNFVEDLAQAEIAGGASSVVTYTNSYTFADAGMYTIEVFPLNDENNGNDTQSTDITIIPAPRGSYATENANFQGTFRSGAETDFDICAAGETVMYDIATPTLFNSADYGSTWEIPLKVETESGMVLPASMYSVTPATASTDAIVNFTPNNAYVDSLLKITIPVKDLGNGCDSTIVRYLFVAPIPFVNFSAPGVCDGDGISFTNLSSISTGTIEFLWDFGSNPPAPSTFTSPVVKYTQAGIYDVKLTATSNWGYKHDTTIKVEIYEAPDVKFRPINACEGDAIDFQNNTSVSSGTIQYAWNFGDGSPEDNTPTPSHLYGTPGEYTVTLTAEANGCTRSLTKSAFQFPQPVADFTVSGGDCDQTEVTFTNNSSLSFGVLGSLWDFGNNDYSTDENTTYNFDVAGLRDVTLKVVSEFGCEDVITKQVNLKESPIANFTNTQTCDIDPVDFTNTSFVPTGINVDYTWTFGDPTSGSNTSNLTNPSHEYNLPGKRTVTLLAEGDNGCTNEISKEIVIGVQPQADFFAETGCTGEPLRFTNTTTISRSDIEVTYDWSFGSDEISPENVFTTSGTQMVTLTATAVDGGCKDEITKEVIIGETPSCEFTETTTGHFDVNFTPVTQDANYTYLWLFGDGGFSSEVAPTYQYDFYQNYSVELRITTPEGCECSNKAVSKITSVNDVNFAERVSVYPNPNTGKFTIAVDGELEDDVTIEIYNSLGAVIAVVDTNQSINGTYTIDLGNVAAGVYTVKFTSATAVYTHKVTVTK